MRPAIIILLIFFCLNQNKAQDFHQIKSLIQADSLIKANHEKLGRFSIYPTDNPIHKKYSKYRNRISDSLKIDSIYYYNLTSKKSNNLLINGRYYYNAAALFCQINNKNNQIFELIGSHNVFYNMMNFAKPHYRFGQKGLDIFIVQYSSSDSIKDAILTNKVEQKFLIWRFNGLVEYNAHPNNYKYDTIQIISSGLYNEHFYKCKFYKNRIMYFQNSALKNEKQKNTHKLNKQEFHTLKSILNYANFQCDTTFDVGFTDSNWIQTDIILNNGKKITITDRGMEKSFILRRFYQFIDQMQAKYFTSK